MHYTDTYLTVACGEELKTFHGRIERFLADNGLDIDSRIEKFVLALTGVDSQIAACAGLDRNVVKCVCVDKKYRGSDLSLVVGTEIIKQAVRAGYDDLFLYTKERNVKRFTGWGFSSLISTPEGVTFMEYNERKFEDYLNSLKLMKKLGKYIGSVVMNANPFTNGHRYLVEQAAKECDWVHVFMVKEDVSVFPYIDRLTLVKDGLADIKNVIVHGGSNYIVSHATFPQYFIKDKDQVNQQASAVDALMFRQYIAPSLGISVRYVGTEPIDETTRMYNCVLKEYLESPSGTTSPVKLREIKRIEYNGSVISASRVRALMQARNTQDMEALVPQSTYEFIEKRLMNHNNSKEFLL